MFDCTSGQQYKIQCSPYIKVDDLITYFLESIRSKLTVNELKEKIIFLYNAQALNSIKNTIKEMKIIDQATITVIDQDGLIGLE